MKLTLAACTAASATFLVATTAYAQVTFNPAEAAMVKGYALDLTKVKSFTAASNAIKRDASSNPLLAKESHHSESSISLSAMMARAKASPATMAYYHKAGLSDADAVLLPVAIADASLSMAVPAAARDYPASSAQMAFVRDHQPEVQAFMASGKQ